MDDAGIAWFAKRQAGVISVAQLAAVGVDGSATAHRVRIDRLFRVHQGVYAVGHEALSQRGWWFAALLAGGPEAVLSHTDALAVWAIPSLPSQKGATHITVPTRRRRTEALTPHHGRPQATTRNGLRVTTVAQTLLDVAQTETEEFVEHALNQAFIARRLQAKALLDLIEASNGRRGTRVLKVAARWQHDHDTITRSQLEREFLRFVLANGFPRPLTNTKLHGFEADFHWPQHRLVVETDGLRCHTTPHAFQRDRHRDRVHRRRGLSVERITWHDVTREPRRLTREVRSWLAAT